MNENNRHWGPENHGCQLSISTSKDRFRQYEPVNLDIVFRNSSHMSVGLARVSNWFDFEWKVQRASGGAVPLTPAAKQQKLALQAGGGGTLLQVAGGGQANFSINLVDIFDLTGGGEIEIQAVRKAIDSERSPFEVVSNPIKIVIAR